MRAYGDGAWASIRVALEGEEGREIRDYFGGVALPRERLSVGRLGVILAVIELKLSGQLTNQYKHKQSAALQILKEAREAEQTRESEAEAAGAAAEAALKQQRAAVQRALDGLILRVARPLGGRAASAVAPGKIDAASAKLAAALHQMQAARAASEPPFVRLINAYTAGMQLVSMLPLLLLLLPLLLSTSHSPLLTSALPSSPLPSSFPLLTSTPALPLQCILDDTSIDDKPAAIKNISAELKGPVCSVFAPHASTAFKGEGEHAEAFYNFFRSKTAPYPHLMAELQKICPPGLLCEVRSLLSALRLPLALRSPALPLPLGSLSALASLCLFAHTCKLQ